jgi:hypothetical protein
MEQAVAAALGLIWEFSVPIDPQSCGMDRHVGYFSHAVTAVTPQAALNVAQTKLDRLYGPGRWAAAQAVVLTRSANRIIVERVRV